MHSVLVIVKNSNARLDNLSTAFLTTTRNDKRIQKSCAELIPGVWLCTSSDGMYGFSALIEAIREAEYPYKLLSFEKEPEWIDWPPLDSAGE
jgi:hypothetical protein